MFDSFYFNFHYEEYEDEYFKWKKIMEEINETEEN